MYRTSLRRRPNLTPVSNVRETAPRSLFWAPNVGLNKLPQVRVDFLYILIRKLTIVFSIGQS